MKKLLLLLTAIAVSNSVSAQTDQANLEKYWKFRNTFKEQFIKIGSQNGESLPAGAIKPAVIKDDLDETQDGTPPDVSLYGEMHWGDGMIRHGHYLALLATEYRLLKDKGQDVNPVLYELYYAIRAINRLDLKAESEQDEFYEADFQPSLNGFFLREDVEQGFGLNWADEEAKIRGTNSVYYHNFKASGGAPDPNCIEECSVYGNSYQNVPSNDQVSSLMVGFSLIHKLVDNVFVQPPGEDSGFNIVTETAAIVDRIVRYAADRNWFIIDVNGWPVANGGGDLVLVAYPLLEAATRITGNDINSYNLDYTRRSVNYRWIQHCITGFGVDWQPSAQVEACDEISDHPIQQYWTGILIESGIPAGPANNQNQSGFLTWQEFGLLNGEVATSSSIMPNLWTNTIPNNWPSIYTDWEEDHIFDDFPWPIDEITFDGLNITSYNNTIFFNYGTMSGLWSPTQADAFADISGNRYLELANAIITNTTPVNNKAFYKELLDGLSPRGPYSFNGYDWEAHNDDGKRLELYKFHNNGWGGEFRWTNKEDAEDGRGNEGMFNAMDYMILHNLYYLLFNDELPAYEEVVKCYCDNELSQTFSQSEEQAEDYGQEFVPAKSYGLSEIHAAHVSLTNKLPYTFNCQPDFFDPINHQVTGVVDVNPKFTNYINNGIWTNKFLKENSVVTSSGQLNIRTRLVLCNTKTLTVNAGGKMDIWYGEVYMNELSVIDISGTVHIHNSAKLKMKGPQCKIIIRAGGKLILDNDAEWLNDYATFVEFYNGAEIINLSANTKITMAGTIKMMNGGIFEIKQQDTHAGKIYIKGEPGFLAVVPAEYKLYGKNKNEQFIILEKDAKIKVFNNHLVNHKVTRFWISNGTITMGVNSQIRAEQPLVCTNILFDAEENANLGILVTERSRFSGCNFNNVAVNAQLILEPVNNTKLMVLNCNFTRDISFANQQTSMLLVNGIGFNISNTNFIGKGLYCVESKNLTLPSSISGSEFKHITPTLPGNTLVGYADNSNTEVKVSSSDFLSLYTGITKNAGKLSIRCSDFNNNLIYNVYASGNCQINASNNEGAGYNTFGKTFDAAIGLNNSKINLKFGRNYFDLLSPYYLSGTLSIPCGINTDCSIDAPKNQWKTNAAPPSQAKFNLIGNDGGQFMVSANQTQTLPSCGAYDNPTGGGVSSNHLVYSYQNPSNQAPGMLPFISTSFDSHIRLDLAIREGIKYMTINDSLGDDLYAIQIFDEILKSDLSKDNLVVKQHLLLSKELMKTAFESAVADERIDLSQNVNSFEPNTQKYVDALNSSTDTVISIQNYADQLQNEFDKAHFFRMLNQPKLAFEILEDAEKCGLDSISQRELNYWKKQYLFDGNVARFGTKLLDTVIVIDTSKFILPIGGMPNEFYFGSQIVTPKELIFSACNKSFNLSNTQTGEQITIYPNPTNGIVNIDLSQLASDIEYKISVKTLEGKVLYSNTTNRFDNGIHQFTLQGLATGMYMIEVYREFDLLYNQKIILSQDN